MGLEPSEYEMVDWTVRVGAYGAQLKVRVICVDGELRGNPTMAL